MDNPKPYYTLLVVILIFIFLWFFIGGKQYEFIGLKPLNPDYIIEYADSYYDTKKVTKKDEKNEKDDVKEDVKELPEIIDDTLCVDITPELPIEFTKPVSMVTNDKFVSRGEKICRDTMEKIYGVPFKNTRPYWLKNDTTGRCLELDCYNEKLKLAVEYNGQNHTIYPNYFHRTYDEFKEQVRRDKLKNEICKKQGVYLITVPYNVSFELIPTYIMYHLPEIVQQRLKKDQVI